MFKHKEYNKVTGSKKNEELETEKKRNYNLQHL